MLCRIQEYVTVHIIYSLDCTASTRNVVLRVPFSFLILVRRSKIRPNVMRWLLKRKQEVNGTQGGRGYHPSRWTNIFRSFYPTLMWWF